MKREIDSFSDLTKNEIKEIATKVFDDDHSLVICNGSTDYIVTDIDDILSYGNISHQIIKMESVEDLKKFFDDTDSEEEDEDGNIISNYSDLSFNDKKQLIYDAEKVAGNFYLAIRHNGDLASFEYEFSIETTYDEALNFVDSNILYFIDDKDKILEKYAENYLKAGYMANEKYERIVIHKYFDEKDLIKKYFDTEEC